MAGQFFKIGWKMVMLGDETWLKLFPGLFKRHDGVSSFYVFLILGMQCFIFIYKNYVSRFLTLHNLLLIQVKDTVQVDQNVSRHLGDELSKDDWDLLVSIFLVSMI